MEEAEVVLQQAEALAPMLGAPSLRSAVAGRVGDADKAMGLYLKLAKSEGKDSGYASSAAMSALYSDSLSAQEVADLHRSLFSSWGEGARSRESFERSPLAGRRLKLGVVSADFHHQHPVNMFMQPVLRELDRNQVELYLYLWVTRTTSRPRRPARARSIGSRWARSTPRSWPSASMSTGSMC